MPIPATGLLKIYPRTVTIISGDFSIAGTGVGSASAITTAAAIEAYYATRLDTPANAPRLRFATEIPGAGGTWVPAAGTYELSFSCDTSRIVFDVNGTPTEIDFLSSDFPMGLTLSQLKVNMNGGYTSGPSRDRTLTDISLKYFGSTVKSLVPSGTVAGDILSSDTNGIIPVLFSWSPIKVFKTFGWSATMSAVVSALLGQPQMRDDLIYLTAVYNTQRWDLSWAPLNVLPGMIATITDANNNLDLFDSYTVSWGSDDPEDPLTGLTSIPIPQHNILVQTPSILKFIVPEPAPFGGEQLIVSGIPDGTIFDGEFPIANFNVDLVDGSGVYKLVEDQAYDTYYNRDVSPSTTVDVKIPDPMVKTGFFNG